MSVRRVLIAPLNWGLGHATRCIPIVQQLLDLGHQPILASDGLSGHVLQEAFPELPYLELPSYQIVYPRVFRGIYWWRKAHAMQRIFRVENEMIKGHVETYRIDLIISDNRYGVYHPMVRSVLITHQLNLATPQYFQKIVSRKLDEWIAPFDHCWVPDVPGPDNLTGMLSDRTPGIPVTYIGPLSRFSQLKVEKEYDVAIVLSGPKPYRRLLLDKLVEVLPKTNKKLAWVLGDPHDKIERFGGSHVYPYLGSTRLNELLCASEIVVSRSGYSSIMDFFRINQKAVLIPTPGQPEQAYLARRHGLRREFSISNDRLSGLTQHLDDLASINPQLPKVYQDQSNITHALQGLL